MIRSFRSRALRALWERDDASRLHGSIPRIKRILSRLNAAVRLGEMAVPGWDFHELTGDRKGTYAVKVTENWRITFEWDGEDAIRVDYEDYH
ncbi:MAG TPA: type II toxin-antitoxin system RelE/ParE family toxin [Stellaceae bacterium]|nr:type II toxin-antitoxin system RelE/ParE family toxin [Stellaceae bacterium]